MTNRFYRTQSVGRITISIGIFFLTLLSSQQLFAFQTTITFETPFPNGQAIVSGTVLDVQYGQDFVTFAAPNTVQKPVIESRNDSAPRPHAGSLFEAMGPGYSQEFTNDPFNITFRTAMSFVQLYGGSDCGGTTTGTLTAFDAAGLPIPGAVNGPITLTPGQTSTLFTVTAPAANIWSISFVTVGPGGPNAIVGCDQSIDDLTVEGNVAPPIPPPPTIALTAPLAGNHDYTFQQGLLATGTVGGTSLFKITIDLTSLNPLPGQAANATREVNFPFTPEQTGIGIPFSFTLDAVGQLPAGNYNLLARVTDGFGQTAQTTVAFANDLPSSDNGLGPFQFAAIAENCEVTFYQSGAVAFSVPFNQLQQTVRTDIALKWLQIAGLGAPVFYPFRTIGCPTDAGFSFGLHDVPAPGTLWFAQDFERGRIYAPSVGGAVYVPKILVHAYDTLNAIRVQNVPNIPLSLPVADPDWNQDTTNPTWVFQRFDPWGLGPAFQSTFEIRGRTPTLYVERVGGDLTELSSAQATATTLKPTPTVDKTTPTIWQQFPCAMSASDRWPTSCDLTGLPQSSDPTSGLPSPGSTTAYSGTTTCNAPISCDQSLTSCGVKACTDAQFQGISGGFPEEWVDRVLGTVLPPPPPPPGAKAFLGLPSVVPVYNPTTYEGLIRALDVKGPDVGSHLANQDYFVDHQECNTNFDQHLQDVVAGAAAIGSCADLPLLLVTEILSLFGDGSNSCSDGAGFLKNTVGANCRSDWNLHTRPLPDPKNWDFLSTGNYRELADSSAEFELEFEAQFAQAYFNHWTPTPGSLVTAHGRPIIDCAHCPFKAEIHPVDMVIVSSSDVPVLQPTFVLHRFTTAAVWGNGFLVQNQPITESAYAPPRTTATSRLLVQEHESGYFVQNSLVTASTQLVTGGMQVTLSGSAPSILIGSDNEWLYPESNPATYVDYWQFSWIDGQ